MEEKSLLKHLLQKCLRARFLSRSLLLEVVSREGFYFKDKVRSLTLELLPLSKLTQTSETNASYIYFEHCHLIYRKQPEIEENLHLKDGFIRLETGKIKILSMISSQAAAPEPQMPNTASYAI